MSLIEDVKNALGALDLTPRPLRRFGLLVGAALMMAGLWLGRRGPHLAPLDLLTALGSGLLLLGLLAPAWLRPLYRPWMGLAFTLGWFTSRLLLVAIFSLVVTPIALAARLAGKRFLELKPDRGAASYWSRRDPGRRVDHRKLW